MMVTNTVPRTTRVLTGTVVRMSGTTIMSRPLEGRRTKSSRFITVGHDGSSQKRPTTKALSSLALNVMRAIDREVRIEVDHPVHTGLGTYLVMASDTIPMMRSSTDNSPRMQGLLSPMHPITLPAAARLAAAIPLNAAFYCFGYPCDHFEDEIEHNDDLDPKVMLSIGMRMGIRTRACGRTYTHVSTSAHMHVRTDDSLA